MGEKYSNEYQGEADYVNKVHAKRLIMQIKPMLND